jgi:polysaccharide deacetylase 2 family uncharacterized protein YibQ
MPARVWQALAGIIMLLLIAVVGLDQWQARGGETSLFGSDLLGGAPRSPPLRLHRARAHMPEAARCRRVRPGGRVVDDLGSRRDVFDVLREIRRPLTVAVLPALPLSAAIARDASRAGMEVLLGLPMEPYRFPEIDPGPGALLMSMPPGEIQRLVGSHLEAVAPAVGVVNRMGSRLTEDRPRMRAVLEGAGGPSPLPWWTPTRRAQSVAFDEARDAGVRAAVARSWWTTRAGRRAIGPMGRVAGWAERRGEVVVVAHGHPLTVSS